MIHLQKKTPTKRHHNSNLEKSLPIKLPASFCPLMASDVHMLQDERRFPSDFSFDLLQLVCGRSERPFGPA